MTLFNITLDLFEGCIRCNEKVLEKLKISTDKQELVDFVEAYKDGDWQEIQCT